MKPNKSSQHYAKLIHHFYTIKIHEKYLNSEKCWVDMSALVLAWEF